MEMKLQQNLNGAFKSREREKGTLRFADSERPRFHLLQRDIFFVRSGINSVHLYPCQSGLSQDTATAKCPLRRGCCLIGEKKPLPCWNPQLGREPHPRNANGGSEIEIDRGEIHFQKRYSGKRKRN